MRPAEAPLPGRTTAGITRIGQTVRRPPSPNAGFVQALLRHLEAVGFQGAPRHLGTDENGRELLSYVPGEVPAHLGRYDDRTLAEAARLIRDYHDATATLFALPAEQAGVEVACHNDLSPCNVVFREGRPVALIDFDAAAPGSRPYDLGYAAWLWLDLGNSEWSAEEQLRRLRLFLAAYEWSGNEGEIISAVLDRQFGLVTEATRTGNTTLGAWAAECGGWTLKRLAKGNMPRCVAVHSDGTRPTAIWSAG